MKRANVLFAAWLVMSLIISKNVSARVWRVDSLGHSANFTNLQTALNTIPAGDTIHLEGFAGNYTSTAVVSKKVTIIGPGYFLAQNPKASTNGYPARIIGNIRFDVGSEGSQLIGVTIDGSFRIAASDIVIKRCLFYGAINMGAGTPISNITIVQNYFFDEDDNFSGDLLFFSSLPTPVSDIIFNNNICEQSMKLPNYYLFSECKNNVFNYGTIINNNYNPIIRMTVGSFQNNILNAPGATVDINSGTNNNVSYNVSSSATGQFGIGQNNVFVPDMATVFVDAAVNTPDGDYQLKTSWSSVPANRGSDITERGVFGGTAINNHYVLSGLAPIPVIYEITTAGVADASGLPVTIKTRTIQ